MSSTQSQNILSNSRSDSLFVLRVSFRFTLSSLVVLVLLDVVLDSCLPNSYLHVSLSNVHSQMNSLLQTHADLTSTTVRIQIPILIRSFPEVISSSILKISISYCVISRCRDAFRYNRSSFLSFFLPIF